MSREPSWDGPSVDLAAATSSNGRPWPATDDDWADQMRRTDEPEPSSWAPIDLGPYLRGEVTRAEPTIGLARSDGLRTLYPGKEHACIGEMECGKSWFALGCAVAELTAGHRVLYIHFEESDPGDTIDRLRALGVPTNIILNAFHFVGPEQPVHLGAIPALLDPAPSLVVLDGVNEAMSLHGMGIREEDGAAQYRRKLVKPFTTAGAAVLSLDHVVKDAERRGRGALGSVHKGNGLSGSLILLENAEPFGRGQRGRSHVFVTKDRPGHLRQHGNADPRTPGRTYLGELVVDDSQSYGPDLTMRFFACRDEEINDHLDASTRLADQVHEVIAQLDNQAVGSERELFAQVRAAGVAARESHVRRAVDDLIAERRVKEVFGKRNAKGYKVTEPVQEQNPTTAAQDHDG